jgi:hypothetical protein
MLSIGSGKDSVCMTMLPCWKRARTPNNCIQVSTGHDTALQNNYAPFNSTMAHAVFILDPWFADPAKVGTNRFGFLLECLQVSVKEQEPFRQLW